MQEQQPQNGGGAGHHQLAQLALHHLLQRMCEVGSRRHGTEGTQLLRSSLGCQMAMGALRTVSSGLSLQVGGLLLLWTVDREVHCFALLCFAWVPLPLMLGALSTAAVPLATACIPITSRSPIPIVAFPKTSFYICAKERQRAT